MGRKANRHRVLTPFELVRGVVLLLVFVRLSYIAQKNLRHRYVVERSCGRCLRHAEHQEGT